MRLPDGADYAAQHLTGSVFLPLPSTARLDPRATFSAEELAGAEITLTEDQQREFERGGGRLPASLPPLTRAQSEALIRAQLFAARRWNRDTALLAAELLARFADLHVTLVHENGTIDTYGTARGRTPGTP
ncbi:hypothetical protein NKH77_28725 [Streptomyces sp. M19]